MPRFYVCQGWVPEDEFFAAALDIEANNAGRAAEVYVETHHADLDWKCEVEIRVLPFGLPITAAKVFDVSVVSIPQAEAKERKPWPSGRLTPE